jgi:hypothetical protein
MDPPPAIPSADEVEATRRSHRAHARWSRRLYATRWSYRPLPSLDGLAALPSAMVGGSLIALLSSTEGCLDLAALLPAMDGSNAMVVPPSSSFCRPIEDEDDGFNTPKKGLAPTPVMYSALVQFVVMLIYVKFV